LYLDRTGCAWRYLPGDFPPWQTVYGYFAAWRDDGTLTRLHDVLRELVRASAGRNAEPTAAVIDSQSVRAADTVPICRLRPLTFRSPITRAWSIG
jgi:transposase